VRQRLLPDQPLQDAWLNDESILIRSSEKMSLLPVKLKTI
jgi:hypothetical protein